MAQVITGIGQAKVLNQLDTYNHTALAASMYMVSVSCDEIPPSGISIAIKQNGSTIVTSVAPTTAQKNVKIQVVLNCALNDVIGIVLSSAVASDTGLNVIKAILNIHQGSA